MFCKKCGTDIPNDSRFCFKCGGKVDGSTDPGIAAAPQPAAKKSSKKTIIIVLSAVFAFLLVISGVFVFVVAPKLNRMMTLEREGNIKGNLASMRAAIVIYYSDKEGIWPTMEVLTSREFKSKYLNMKDIPADGIMHSNKIVNKFDGTGGWYYVDDMKSEYAGSLHVNLKGNDTRGRPYSEY